MISNSTITNTTFEYNVTLLNVQNATIDRCSFKGLINNALISGNLTKCQFEGLSNGIVINGPLSDMTIQSDITPSSANYVLNSVVITDFVSISTLIISLNVVPRLAESLHKECFVATKDGKQVFMVQLATDDNTPKGIILMWSGDINNVPSGYGVCDGRVINGVLMPDLSGRFIRMISLGESTGDKPNSDLTDNGSGTRNGYIQIHDYNLPAHIHKFNLSASIDISNLSTDTKGGPYSKTYPYIDGSLTTRVNEGEGSLTYAGDDVSISTDTISFDWTHSHSIKGSASLTNVNLTLNDDTYRNDKINIEPNAYALIFIMKL